MKAITKRALNASQCKDGLRSNFCVVLGLQWGHEGKYKLLNKLCPGYDYSCRFNGGALTEPTELENGDLFRILPNGIKHETKVRSLLGNGVVIDPTVLLSDFATMQKNGIDLKGRLVISDRANIVTSLHKQLVKRLKELRHDAPWLTGEDMTHAFKPMKMALRMSHLVDDWSEFEDKYQRVRKTCEQLFNLSLSPEELALDLESLKLLRDIAKNNGLVTDTVVLLNQEIKNQKRILVEDASSSSMDVDTGLYPFTDSFHTTTGAVCTGLGVPEEAIETTIGVFSAVSIVRNAFLERIQDFPTHIRPEDPAYSSIKDRLEREYGVLANDFAFGWTDLNLIRHAELINKLSSMMLTHLDVLSNLETIKLATRYSLDTGTGEPQIFDRSLPAKLDDWELMVPEYIQMPGWKQDLSGFDSFAALPIEAQSFIRKLEQVSKKEVQYVSINDQRDEGILRIVR